MIEKTSNKVSVPDLEFDRFEYLFKVLNEAWKFDTRYESSATKIVSHPVYQLIIEMGEVMVPVILSEVSSGSNHWFYALRKITGHNPKDAGILDFDKLRTSWMNWSDEQENTAWIVKYGSQEEALSTPNSSASE